MNKLTYIDEVRLVVEQINEAFPKYKNVLALTPSQTARILKISETNLKKLRDKKEGVEFVSLEYSAGEKQKRIRILYPKVKIAELLLGKNKEVY